MLEGKLSPSQCKAQTCLYLISICLVLFYGQGSEAGRSTEAKSTSEVARLTRNCARNPSMPSTVFTPQNPCDKNSNCRYGGFCQKSEVVFFDKYLKKKEKSTLETCNCEWKCRNYPKRSRANSESEHVCGTDGRTYVNECKLRLAACRCQYPIEIKRKGPCQREPLINTIPLPYGAADVYSWDTEGSGSGDDVTKYCEVTCKYGAVCDVDAEDGPCLCKMECHGTLQLTVCGTDGRSYYNECYLRQTSCQQQVDLQLAYNGACKNDEVSVDLLPDQDGSGDEDDEDTICNTLNCAGDIIHPVCGSDGVDYPNKCILRHAACIHGTPLRVSHSGYCDPERHLTDANAVDGNSGDSADPCDSVYCLFGAVCVPQGTEDFECSCDSICKKESVMAQQNSLAHLGGISMNRLMEFLPELGSQLRYDEEQELFEARQQKMATPLTQAPTFNEKSFDYDGEGPIIDYLDDVTEMRPIRFVSKGGHQGYVGDDFDYRRNKRRKHGGNTRRSNAWRKSSHRLKRSINSHARNYVNETICGDDGKTYKDECQMMIHACHAKKTIKIKKNGACPYRLKSKKETGLTYTTTTARKSTTVLPKTTQSVIKQSTEVIGSSTKKLDWTSKASSLKSSSWGTRENSKNSFFSDASPSARQKIYETTIYDDTYHTTILAEITKESPILKTEISTEESEDAELGPGSRVSEVHAMEYSWLIAVAVMGVSAIIGLGLGFCYAFHKNKAKLETQLGKNEAVQSSNHSLATQTTNVERVV